MVRLTCPAWDNDAVDPEPIPVTRAVDFGTAKLLPDVDRARAWLLTVDGAPQSYVDLDDPVYLEFEYVRRLAHAVDAVFDEGRPLDVVHLGGGALTLPRRMSVTRPGSRQDVVEADRGLVALVSEHLPLEDPAVVVHTDDARGWLERAAPDSADVLVADVFGGSRVPAHLTSVEFLRSAASVVRAEGGLYLANLADAAPFAFLGSQIAGVREVFEHCCVIAEPGMLRGRRFGNAVLLGSHGPLPLDRLARLAAADAFPARVVDGKALARLAAGASPVYDATAVPSPEPPDGAFTVG